MPRVGGAGAPRTPLGLEASLTAFADLRKSVLIRVVLSKAVVLLNAMLFKCSGCSVAVLSPLVLQTGVFFEKII